MGILADSVDIYKRTIDEVSTSATLVIGDVRHTIQGSWNSTSRAISDTGMPITIATPTLAVAHGAYPEGVRPKKADKIEVASSTYSITAIEVDEVLKADLLRLARANP